MPKICSVCGKVEGQILGSVGTVGQLKDPHAVHVDYKISIPAFDLEWGVEDYQVCSVECALALFADEISDLRKLLEEHRREENAKSVRESVARDLEEVKTD